MSTVFSPAAFCVLAALSGQSASCVCRLVPSLTPAFGWGASHLLRRKVQLQKAAPFRQIKKALSGTYAPKKAFANQKVYMSESLPSYSPDAFNKSLLALINPFPIRRTIQNSEIDMK